VQDDLLRSNTEVRKPAISSYLIVKGGALHTGGYYKGELPLIGMQSRI